MTNVFAKYRATTGTYPWLANYISMVRAPDNKCGNRMQWMGGSQGIFNKVQSLDAMASTLAIINNIKVYNVLDRRLNIGKRYVWRYSR